MAHVFSEEDLPRCWISGMSFVVRKLTWTDGAESYEVFRVLADRLEHLTEDEPFDRVPTDEEILSLVSHADSNSFDPETVVTWNLAQLVKGQTAVTICGCGEWIAEYEGEWMHILNPKLTGNDDHDAYPG